MTFSLVSLCGVLPVRDFIFGFFIDVSVTPKVFKLLTFALANIRCQVFFYITTKDKMSDYGSFVMLSFYITPLELVHRVYIISLSRDEEDDTLKLDN